MKRILLLSFAMLFGLFGQTFAQERTVSGKVTAFEDNSPLPGVTVVLKEAGTGVSTDLDGNYKINVPASGGTLVFSFVGYTSEEVAIGARSVVDMALTADIRQLSEVVVVGYGTQSAKYNVQSVASVDNSAFEKMPIMTAQEALQGQAAGVQMVSGSGVIGSNQAVRVRGVASLTAGTSPLYVVDGVPLNDRGYANNLGSPSTLNPLMELNPNEIKSINVLKDAAAVAIYGSRGANGVILIETKKGAAGATKFNVDYYQGVSEATTVRPYMSRQQYNDYVGARIGATSENQTLAFLQANYGIDGSQGFDWGEAMFKQGSMSNLNVSASGGSDKTQFFISGNRFTQDSYIFGNEAERYNARLNLLHSANDRTRIGTNIGISYLENDRINSDNSTFAPATSAFLHLPYTRPFQEDGSYTRLGFIPNLLAIYDLGIFEYKTRRTTANTFVEYDIIEGLTLKTDIGVDQIQSEETLRYPDIVRPDGYGYKRILQDNKLMSTTTLNYENSFGSNHYLSILGGYSYEQSNLRGIAVEGNGFVSDALPNVGSAANPTQTSATWTGWRLSSFFTRANYRFMNKYIAEASLRRDGSSRFGANNKYGNFWSVAGGWIISEESFLQGVGFLDLLKLRTSYGTSGNDRIGDFPSLGLYAGGALGDYAGSPGLYPSNPANANLGWEQTAQFDVTLSSTMFKNKLDIEVSYYDKLTTGLLLNVPLPFTTGFPSFTENAGTMRNSGIDALVRTTNVNTLSGFMWTTTFNIGYLKNEVIDLPGAAIDPDGNPFVARSASQRAIVGHPANTFYLVRFNGVNPETGDAEWFNADGELTTAYSANDRAIVGKAIPTFTGGLTNTFSFKGLEVSAFFTFVTGNHIMYDDLRFMYNPNNVLGFNLDPALLDYWQNPGDNAFAPRLGSPTTANFAQRSTQQLVRGDYLRLRNLSISYNLPKSTLVKTKVFRTARVYAQAQNWFTWSYAGKLGLEPEVSDSAASIGESFFTPVQPRTVTLGLSFGF